MNLLKSSLIFTCLSNLNHCISFIGSNSKLYSNQLCFDTDTMASDALKNFNLNFEEQNLLQLWNLIIELAKNTKNYDSKYKYGIYQITKELNTFKEDEEQNKIYDYPELNGYLDVLKNNLNSYYKNNIEPLLFKYELLK